MPDAAKCPKCNAAKDSAWFGSEGPPIGVRFACGTTVATRQYLNINPGEVCQSDRCWIAELPSQLAALTAENNHLRTAMAVDEGWRVVSGEHGSVLIESPTGNRRRIAPLDEQIVSLTAANQQIAELQGQVREAESERDRWHQQCDMVTSQARKDNLRAELADQYELWLLEIGKLSGCAHVDERLPRCIEEHVAALQQQIAELQGQVAGKQGQ